MAETAVMIAAVIQVMGTNMIELAFIVCLMSAPHDCGQKVIKFMPGQSAALCMYHAQPMLAAWVGQRPDYRVTKWRCREMADSLAERNDPDAAPPL